MVAALRRENTAFPRRRQPAHELVVNQLQGMLDLVPDGNHNSLLAVFEAIDDKFLNLKIAIAAKCCLPSLLTLRRLDGPEIMPHRASIIATIGQLILENDTSVAVNLRVALYRNRVRFSWIVRNSHELWIFPIQHEGLTPRQAIRTRHFTAQFLIGDIDETS